MEKLLSEKELMKLLGVSRTFLWEMRTYENLPYCQLGRIVRYHPEMVSRWLREFYKNKKN